MPYDRFLSLLRLIHLHANVKEPDGRLPCTSVDAWARGNSSSTSCEDSDPACSLFHLALDCRWTVLSAVQYLSQRPPAGFSSSSLPLFADFGGWAPPQGIIFEDDGPLGGVRRSLAFQTMVELAGLAAGRFSSLGAERTLEKTLGTSSPFRCHCAREMWLLLILSQQGSFWTLLRALMAQKSKSGGVDDDSISTESVVECRVKPLHNLCSWWLFATLAELIRLDPKGETKDGREALPPTSDLRMTEALLLKDSLGGQGTEITIRSALCLIMKASDSLGSPSLLTLTNLLEHFLKQLNNHFADKEGSSSTLGVGQVQVLPLSLPAWILKLEKRQQDQAARNSFELFIDLLDRLASLDSGLAKKMQTKLVGRLKVKMTHGKLRQLSDLGWYHFFLVILCIARGCAAFGDSDSLSKWHGFVTELLQNPEVGGDTGKKPHVVAMGLGTVAVHALVAGADLGPVLKVFMKRLDSAIQALIKTDNDATRTACQVTVRVYTDLVQECLSAASKRSCPRAGHQAPLLRHACLVSSFFAKYLDRCLPSEVDRLATALVTLTTKMRRFYKEASHRGAPCRTAEEQEMMADVRSTQEAVWKNIYPSIEQSLCLNPAVAPSPKLAELCTSLLLLSLDLPASMLAPGHRRFEDLLEFFACSPAVRPELSSQVLTNFLQQGGHDTRRTRFVAASAGDRGFADPVVRGWVRCAVHSAVSAATEGDGDISSAVESLTEEILLMDTFQDLSPTTTEGEASKRGLEIMFSAIGRRHLDLSGSADFFEQKYLPFLELCVAQMTEPRILQRGRVTPAGLYRLATSLLNNCSSILWARKNLPNSLLSPLLTFSEMKDPQRLAPAALLSAIEAFLPFALRALVSIESHNSNPYVIRTVKELIVIYFPRYPAERSPFAAPFGTRLAVTEEQRSWLQKHLFTVLKTEYFAAIPMGQQRVPEGTAQNRRLALSFLLHVLELDDNGDVMKKLCKTFFHTLLEVRTKSMDDPSLKRSSSELLRLIVKGRRKCDDTGNVVVDQLAMFVRQHMGFFSQEVVDILKAFKVLDRSLVKAASPVVMEQVMLLKEKRGYISKALIEQIESLQN